MENKGRRHARTASDTPKQNKANAGRELTLVESFLKSSFSSLSKRRQVPRLPSEESMKRGDVNVETLGNTRAVLMARAGSVLRRQTILKCDHFPQVPRQRGIELLECPNFRSLDYKVYGVAQPTSLGLSTILTLLGLDGDGRCGALWISTREEPVIYICGKPYVLRDLDSALQNIKGLTGISASRLEQMEQRLRDDVVRETARYGGLLLVHDEGTERELLPKWIAADLIQTPREVVGAFQESGLLYARVPVGPEQAPDPVFFDSLGKLISAVPLDCAVVISCGMGGGRTTVGTIVAIVIRHKMIFDMHLSASKQLSPSPLEEQRSLPHHVTLPLLRVMHLLERGFDSHMLVPHSAIEWALARGGLMDHLIQAVLGNYSLILGLVKLLDAESLVGAKALVDSAIDHCDSVVNIREEILLYRIRHSTDKGTDADIRRAVFAIERYFMLIAFAAYATNTDFFKITPFSIWYRQRPEIGRMTDFISSKNLKLDLFRPVDDLSELAGRENCNVGEVEAHVLAARSGTILTSGTLVKIDLWMGGGSTDTLRESQSTLNQLKNFRQVAGCPIYGVAQPTIEGYHEILQMIKCETELVWINLREEPLIYISGNPHILREQYATDEIKSYGGINAERLELLESRIQEDLIVEIEKYSGKLLIHDKVVYEKGVRTLLAEWHDVSSDQISTVRQVAEKLKIFFYRVPVTSQNPPEEEDFDVILRIVCKYPADCPIIVNCQAGIGRSTTGTAILWLIRNWLLGSKKPQWTPKIDGTGHVPAFSSMTTLTAETVTYKCIHYLLRVIPDGIKVKDYVDRALNVCGKFLHISQSIEKDKQNPQLTKRALLNLKRYFLLISFQAYLEDNEPTEITTLETFKAWMKRHHEVQRMYHELNCEFDSAAMMDALTSVEKQTPGDGIAFTSEIAMVVQERCGAVLARLTILKSDAFLGCQKLSLPERIEGAANFRFVSFSDIQKSLLLALHIPFNLADSNDTTGVCGVAMPTRQGIQNVLTRLKSTNKIVWTCLREEPVLYINSRPFVLRTFQDPLRNLETTGIAMERVELMETNMKEDCLLELELYQGRLLLHDEAATKNGFEIVPLWESVKQEDMLTPLEAFSEHKDFIDYLRIPITDEQAPIAHVFDQLIERTCMPNKTFVFNCQMGRGRTTTCIIITCIIHGILLTKHPFFSDANGGRGYADWDMEEEIYDNQAARYKRGEYQIILRLVSVLAYGKMAKAVADTCIDACADIQNLREEIYTFKIRLESMTTTKYKIVRQVGINYLVRYFYLIAFAGYLLEIVTHTDQVPTKFSDWLKERREIVAIIKADEQDFA